VPHIRTKQQIYALVAELHRVGITNTTRIGELLGVHRTHIALGSIGPGPAQALRSLEESREAIDKALRDQCDALRAARGGSTGD
jgi:hypothetical protein